MCFGFKNSYVENIYGVWCVAFTDSPDVHSRLWTSQRKLLLNPFIYILRFSYIYNLKCLLLLQQVSPLDVCGWSLTLTFFQSIVKGAVWRYTIPPTKVHPDVSSSSVSRWQNLGKMRHGVILSVAIVATQRIPNGSGLRVLSNA
jgi:hypothetical protein